MSDEKRDPDFEWVRSQWKPPEPPSSAELKILDAYRAHHASSRQRWKLWISVPAAALVLLMTLVWQAPWNSRTRDAYRPVEQPRFIVVSQGENP
jgi:hypothetical protein